MFTVIGYRKITSKKTGEIFYILQCIKTDLNDRFVVGSSVKELFIPASLYDVVGAFEAAKALKSDLKIEVYFDENARPRKIEEI